MGRYDVLPEQVATAVRARWHEQGERWCQTVEQQLADFCTRFHAEPVGVLRSRYGLVVGVRTDDGRDLVFRASPDPHARDQHVVIGALARLGVGPAVYEFATTEAGSWSVLDRVNPGTPIGDMPWNAIDTTAIAATLRSLAGQHVPSATLPSLFDWLRQRFQDDELTDLAPGTGRPSAEERQRGLAILRDLETSHVAGLCHGDASPWNLLVGDGGRVMLIDPRGVTGEVAYDVAVVALKASSFVPLVDSVPHLAASVEVDGDRVEAWAEVAALARV
jgi:streptomycin 6-kinase